jgi:glycerol-3-phosphate dehydrogenase
VLIVGGGINGAGLYRDLAAQSVPAALVEQGDFCSGTSAAPSRLIHGGLRYLETGEFALVRESVEERDRLLANAPHLVRPLCCWVPCLSWAGGALQAGLRFLKLLRTPGRKGALVVKLGLMAYDAFSGAHAPMPRHRLVGRGTAGRLLPGLAPEVRAVAEYYDARITHPERLVVELVADAEADCPDSVAVPYLAVDGMEGGAVLLQDRISGERFAVTPGLVVNVAGAWADRVDARLGIEERLIGGTKGSHLVVASAELAHALGERMLYFETFDGRACLAYRLAGDRVLLGTTDLRSDDPDDMACSEAEIDYLFAVLKRILPGVTLRREQVAFAFAGVRPLPRSDGLVAGAISRDHSLRAFEPDGPERPFAVLTLVGGKWTTYRAAAAQIVDAVLARLGRARRVDTKGLPIGGGRGWPGGAHAPAVLARRLMAEHGLTPERAAVLVDRYGTAAARTAASDDGPLAAMPGYGRGEIARLVREERVTRLEDLVLRRTLLAFEQPVSAAALEELAGIAGDVLGWSLAMRRREVAATTALLRSRHGVPTPAEAA